MQKHSSVSLGRNEADVVMFQERCGLVMKWFSKWNPEQRRVLLHELLVDCTTKESDFLHQHTQRYVPQVRVDMTVELPRRLSLKIFSYLDPRSLCRCAQVNSRWHWLSEANEVWLPKCNRLRWLLPPEGHEDIQRTMRWTGGALLPDGVYKRLYRDNLLSLQHDGVALMERHRLLETSRRQDAQVEAERQTRLETSRRRQLPLMQAPWHSSGAAPAHRFNVLDSQDIQRMDSRRRDPPPRNTMRSVVQVPSGRPFCSSINISGSSPERAELRGTTATMLNTSRSFHATRALFSESTTQTPAALWRAASAAAAAAAAASDEDGNDEKKKKDKKKKKKNDKAGSGEDESDSEGGDKKKDKKKKKKDKAGSGKDESDSDGDEKKKDKKKKKKKDKAGSGKDESDSDGDEKKKDKKKKKKKDKAGSSEDESDSDGGDKKKKDKKKKKKEKAGSSEDESDSDGSDKKKKDKNKKKKKEKAGSSEDESDSDGGDKKKKDKKKKKKKDKAGSGEDESDSGAEEDKKKKDKKKKKKKDGSEEEEDSKGEGK
ncbi:hypothetical protein BOX15_Mlig016352g2, partial [Macrostomum lignano]